MPKFLIMGLQGFYIKNQRGISLFLDVIIPDCPAMVLLSYHGSMDNGQSDLTLFPNWGSVCSLMHDTTKFQEDSVFGLRIMLDVAFFRTREDYPNRG